MTTSTDLSTDRMAGRSDDLYAALIAAHEGLDAAESAALNARLILMLANLVGEPATVIDAIAAARSSGSSTKAGK